jgi:hypothetical protein
LLALLLALQTAVPVGFAGVLVGFAGVLVEWGRGVAVGSTPEDETEEGEGAGEGSEEPPSAKLTMLGPATTNPSRESVQMLGHLKPVYIPGKLVRSLEDGLSAPPFITLT